MIPAAVEFLVSSGAGEEAIGKTIREMGLTDKVVELGKKLPGGKAVFDAVDERTEMALHQLGMDLDKMNLTRDGENDVIKLVEAANGLTDEELGGFAKLTASELTPVSPDAIMKTKDAISLKSRNMGLEGKCHSETNVPFERTSLEMDGTKYEIVEPRFDCAGQITLEQTQYKAPRRKQRKESNIILVSEPAQQDQLKRLFAEDQIASMKKGITPKGYTWHHAATPGVMQLVPSEIHQKTGHTGGYSIWGLGAKTGGS